ncbi:MAG: Helix-turn-helix domain [Fimbriimonadaceae bacterium]|jgi:DNA-binding transcriptional ArsR family regulator|nr:Helix-turn-helix domain [Fimbriimonadaceae bacterium]
MTLSAEQLKCLASPARNEVFTQLRILGKASIGDVAKALGKKPESVHYHMKGLVSAGLAKEAFRRPAPKKPESVYEPVGRKLRLPAQDSGSEIATLTRKAVAAGLRQTLRGYQKASQAAEHSPKVRARMHVIKASLRLKAADAEAFFKLIEAASRFADEHRDDSGERLVWSSLVYPVIREKG